MKLFKPTVRVQSKRQFEINASFEWRGQKKSFFVKYTSTESDISPCLEIDALACMMCPMTVANGAIMSNQEPIDAHLKNNLERYAKLWNTYNLFEPKLESIQEYALRTEMPARETQFAEARRVYSSFSAGVDSFHTLFSNFDRVTDLVCVLGCDISLWNTNLINLVKPRMEEIGKATGKNVIFVETNARDVLESIHNTKGNNWGRHFHGPLFFSFIHYIAGPKVYLFPSSYTQDSYVKYKYQWGSSYDADPLFSSTNTKVIHYGTENRFDKVKYLLDCPLFIQHARVCWENNHNLTTPKYNCGTCSKCKRLLVTLYVLLYKEKEKFTQFSACFPSFALESMNDEKAILYMKDEEHSEQFYTPAIIDAWNEIKK